MDRPLPPRRRWRRVLLAAGLLLLAALGLARSGWAPSPVLDAPQLAPAVQGEFRDELLLRARVEPLRVVALDAQESGRVEEVLARDGDWVEAGTRLYRLHSREHEQLLMQRSSEVAQQLANVSVQRSALASTQAQSRRELTQLRHAHRQAQADSERQAALAQAGFVSAAAQEHSQRQVQLAAQLLQQAQVDADHEAQERQRSLAEMGRAVQGLQQGLALLQRSRELLQQRAPITGRLSGFVLHVGASLRTGERLGHIHDPSAGVQLLAEADEFYLPRLRTGLQASSPSGPLTLAQLRPQVQGGKLTLALRWAGDKAPADLRPGQNVDLRLQLSAPTPALLLPEGPGLLDGAVYVRQGQHLQRRAVRLGRRAAGQVEVLAGLQAGEQVLISKPPFDSPQWRLP